MPLSKPQYLSLFISCLPWDYFCVHFNVFSRLHEVTVGSISIPKLWVPVCKKKEFSYQPVFQLLFKIIYSCCWDSGSVRLCVSIEPFALTYNFPVVLTFFSIMLPLSLALSLVWIRFNVKVSNGEGGGTSVWLNHFKYFSNMQRKALLGTSDVLSSTEPGFFQFRGACGALKWVQLWQTGGAQGLFQITLFCVLWVSRWEGSYHCCAVILRDLWSVGLSLHCLLPMLNRRTEFGCRTQLQRVPCVVLKLRKIHAASRAEQLHVKTDICVSKCLSGLTPGFVSPAEVDEHFKARDLAFVFVLSLRKSILWIRIWQAVTWNHQKRVLLCLILVSLVGLFVDINASITQTDILIISCACD